MVPPSLIFKSTQGGQPKPTFSTLQTQRLPISASTQSTQTVCVPGSVCVCEKFAYVYTQTKTLCITQTEVCVCVYTNHL